MLHIFDWLIFHYFLQLIFKLIPLTSAAKSNENLVNQKSWMAFSKQQNSSLTLHNCFCSDLTYIQQQKELSVESSQLPPQGLMMIIPKKLFTLSGDLLRICDSLSYKRWHFPTFERTILVVEFVKEWVAHFFSNLAISSHIRWASIAHLWLTIL